MSSVYFQGTVVQALAHGHCVPVTRVPDSRACHTVRYSWAWGSGSAMGAAMSARAGADTRHIKKIFTRLYKNGFGWCGSISLPKSPLVHTRASEWAPRIAGEKIIRATCLAISKTPCLSPQLLVHVSRQGTELCSLVRRRVERIAQRNEALRVAVHLGKSTH